MAKMSNKKSNSPALLKAMNTLRSISAPASPSKGCGKILPVALKPDGSSTNFTLYSPSGGGERRYLLHLPKNFSQENDEPAPLIIALHAFGQTTTSMEDITQLSTSEMNQDHIVVYPEGINNVWLGDPGAPNSTIVDDRPFMFDLLNAVESMLCVDTSRIYATGFSNGGGLSGLLACYPPTAKRIAAFSGVSAAYYTKGSLGYSLFEKEACQTHGRATPIPFLDIHGDSDRVIAYNGDNSKVDFDQDGLPDPDTLPIPVWLHDWAERNGCTHNASATLSDYLDTGDVFNASDLLENGSVMRSTWDCSYRSDVVVGYRSDKLGHGWPSTTPLDGLLEELRGGPATWNATALLLDWFARWVLI